MPEISVIIPLYNAEKYIRAAVESILNQTFSDFELIIIDDYSSDNSLKIVETYDDPRICIIRNSYNMGVSAARNIGIANSKGSYLALMDNDDISYPLRLEKQIDFLKANRDIDAVGGIIQNIDSDSQPTTLFSAITLNNPKYIKAVLLFINVFTNGAMMYRKKVLTTNNILFRDDCYGLEDFLFLVEFSKVGNISSVDELVLGYRRHENNAEKKIFIENRDLREKQFAKIQQLSLDKSGFKLSDRQLEILNKGLAEQGPMFETIEEFTLLYETLTELLIQAQTLSHDNFNELKIYFSKCLIKVLHKLCVLSWLKI